MSRRLSPEVSGRISEIMFKDFSDSEEETFLKKELSRYIPQFKRFSDLEISDFINYQRGIWLQNAIPKLGKPIASLNPTFADSIDAIKVNSKDLDVYTRASTKENGYRLQLHNGPQDKTVLRNVSAFTRQFTPYDLRMFPELYDLFLKLPVMVGDTELINKKYTHLAGFNRVHERFPNNVQYWPRKSVGKIDDDLLKRYLGIPNLFENGFPKEEFELTLAFHGLFAIAHPDTWKSDEREQLESLESVCGIPMDYRKVDELLEKLNNYIEENKLNARVVEREVISNKPRLKDYVKEKESEGLEGVVVVQYAEDKNKKASFKHAKSIKIKKYETIDTVLLGLYLSRKSDGIIEENLQGALLGLYDENLDCNLPVCRVNLNPDGVQIKTKGQKERLSNLRKELVDICEDKENSGAIKTLYDAYIMQGKIKLSYIFGDKFDSEKLSLLFNELPRGQNFLSLFKEYNENKKEYDINDLGTKKISNKKDKWIHDHRDVLSAVSGLKQSDEGRYKDVINYFSKASDIKIISKKLYKPQFVLDTKNPVILETNIFDIKWNKNPYPAGFHTWHCNSFHFNNCFAERVRFDKASTTDYQTIYDFARKNTVRKRES